MRESKMFTIPIMEFTTEEATLLKSADRPKFDEVIKRMALLEATHSKYRVTDGNETDDSSSPDALKNELLEMADLFRAASPHHMEHMTDETVRDDLTIQLDWAAQIREASDLPWAQCLEIAGVFYYG
jgi:hypothetical protein